MLKTEIIRVLLFEDREYNEVRIAIEGGTEPEERDVSMILDIHIPRNVTDLIEIRKLAFAKAREFIARVENDLRF